MKPIYKPKGRAGEYADWALNIYTGCTHGCAYCYAPAVLRKSKESFAEGVAVREGLLDSLEKQLAGGGWDGRTVHLCFTCDPYPKGVDTRPTRKAIKLLHDAGASVQILTKNPTVGSRDFDLLGPDDMFGTSITGAGPGVEPNSDPESMREFALRWANALGIGTWVSCEPVYDEGRIKRLVAEGEFIDLFKVGKLNHAANDVDWGRFGYEIERLLQSCKRNYVIKDDLRREMEKVV